MYQINQSNEGVDILWDGKIILEGIIPVVSFEDGLECRPAFKESSNETGEDKQGCFTGYSYKFIDDQSRVSFLLHIKCYLDILLVSVDMQCKVELYEDLKLLSSVGGIRLEVDNLGDVDGLMANYLFNAGYWTRPHFGKKAAGIPAKTQSLLWKNDNGYCYILPVCGSTFKSELGGNGKALEVVVSAYASGFTNCNTLSFIAGVGPDPFSLAERVVLKGFETLKGSGEARVAKKYPEFLEYLGWCSWNAFYYDVNQEGMIAKFDEFKMLALPVKWALLDAGWSPTKDEGLTSFKEDPLKFPDGLQTLGDRLKKDYGVEWFGVWHAFLGYWNGIHPESTLSVEMKENIHTLNSGKLLPGPDAGKAFKFWDSWHSYLRKQGIDFIKVDGQSSLGKFIRGNIPVGMAASESHKALEASAAMNFNNRVINCMGMSAEALWNRPTTPIARCSDDFYPEREGSFKEHALQNAYNSFYHSHFIWGDWDMWWTKHESAINSAVLRAVSGGPIYTSEQVAGTDPSRIWPLILSDGRILRCDRPGLPTCDCLLKNPNEETIPLKIWNTYGKTGVLAVFNINIQGKTVFTHISPMDIPYLEGEQFALFDFFEEEASILKKSDCKEVALDDNGVKLFIIVPINQGFAEIGLVDKYIAPAAVLYKFSRDKKEMIVLKDGGKFGFVSDKRPNGVLVNGKETAVSEAKGFYTVDCSDFRGLCHIEIHKLNLRIPPID